MPWYKAGTVSVVQNSNAVIGTGTAFIANSRVGDAFRGPDGAWYEVVNIASNTAISISPVYQGATNATGTYALAPMQGYVKDSADALRSLVNQYGETLASLGTTGNYDILPVEKGGTGAITGSAALTNLGFSNFAKTLVDDVDAAATRTTLVAAKSGANSDITELNGLTKSITAAQGGVDSAYIVGLIPQWISATAVSVSSGTAYIPGPSKSVGAASTLTLSGLTLAANTWYYLYLYDNAGVPTIELVTTAPSAPYSGSARTKAGDTSRRFICPLRTGASGLRTFVPFGDFVLYTENQSALTILSGGTATSSTVVSAAAFVPMTTQRCSLGLFGGGGTTMSVGFPGGGEILSCSAGSRFVADAVTDASQNIRYFFNGAPSAGGTISVSGYGMDR